MRRLLISAAALALLAAPALAQPDNNPHRIGKASMGADVQDRSQQQLGVQAPPGQPPQQGGGNRGGGDRGDRGGNRGAAAAPAAQPQVAQPQVAAPQDRGNQDRGGYNRGGNGGPTAFTNQISGSPPPDNAQQNRGDRGYGQGRDNNNYRGDRGNGRDDRGDGRYNGYRNGQDRGDRGYGRDDRNNGYGDSRRYGGGQRRDFSNFRDFHRSFRAERHFRAPYYRRPAGWYDHRWTFGEFLPAAFWARDYWLSDFSAYDLPPPPYGAVWVRVNADALLVDRDSGEVISIAYGVFY